MTRLEFDTASRTVRTLHVQRAHGAAAKLRVGLGRVVLAAGALNTPRLLLRSGLGPASVLGADTRVRNDAVGRELHDHVSAQVSLAPNLQTSETGPRFIHLVSHHTSTFVKSVCTARLT